MRKKKKELIRSEKPEMDMERDMAQYVIRQRIRRVLRGICALVAVLLLGVLFYVIWHSWGNTAPGDGGAESGTDTESATGTEAPPETMPEIAPVPASPAITKEELYRYDPAGAPEGCLPIRPMDLSYSSLGSDYIVNATGYSPSLLPYPALEPFLISGATMSDAPLVLVIHTHTTESYTADPAVCDAEMRSARSEDPGKNMIAVGEAFAAALRAAGVPAVHCTEVFDAPSVSGSYVRAADRIAEYLAAYPSIRYVIDIHRDAVTDSAGNPVRAVTLADGEPTAQVLFVVGTDRNGTECSWERNFTLAQAARSALNAQYGTLCRPTALKASSYNQELAPVSFLIEIGTAANTLGEAERAAEIVGKTLGQLLKP